MTIEKKVAYGIIGAGVIMILLIYLLTCCGCEEQRQSQPATIVQRKELPSCPPGFKTVPRENSNAVDCIAE